MLEATSGYRQIALDESSKDKTAFSYKNGFYEFIRMTFGLFNAPATFQRVMDKIFRKHLGIFVLPYLDDVIVFSENEKDHEKHLEIVMSLLKSANIHLNKKKCEFFKRRIQILDYIIENTQIFTDPERSRAISEYERPSNIKELRSFLGMAGF